MTPKKKARNLERKKCKKESKYVDPGLLFQFKINQHRKNNASSESYFLTAEIMVAVGWKALKKRKEEIERKETMGNVDLGL